MTAIPTYRESVSHHSERLRSAIKSARARIPFGDRQRAPYAAGIAKAALGDRRSKCCEQITALVIEVARYGSLEDAESIASTLRMIARAEWERTHPVREQTYDEAWEAESVAQDREDACERAFATARGNYSASAYDLETLEIRYAAAHAVYVVAQERFHDAMRREIQRRLGLTNERPALTR